MEESSGEDDEEEAYGKDLWTCKRLSCYALSALHTNESAMMVLRPAAMAEAVSADEAGLTKSISRRRSQGTEGGREGRRYNSANSVGTMAIEIGGVGGGK